MRIWLSSCMRSVGCELLLETRNVLLQFEGDKLSHFSVGKAVGGKQAGLADKGKAGQVDQRVGVGQEQLVLENRAVLVAGDGNSWYSSVVMVWVAMV